MAVVKKKVDASWTIDAVIEAKGMEAARLLAEAGLHCAGCMMARGETLEQGCKAHGLNDEEVARLVERLNALK